MSKVSWNGRAVSNPLLRFLIGLYAVGIGMLSLLIGMLMLFFALVLGLLLDKPLRKLGRNGCLMYDREGTLEVVI